jgi:hypothetical protein
MIWEIASLLAVFLVCVIVALLILLPRNPGD